MTWAQDSAHPRSCVQDLSGDWEHIHPTSTKPHSLRLFSTQFIPVSLKERLFSTKKQNVHKKLDFFTIGFMSKMAAAASRVRVIDLVRSGQVVTR